MNAYRILLSLHVSSAMLLVGGSIAGILVRSAVRRCGTTEGVSAVLALGRPLAVLNPVSAITLLGTGIYLTSLRHWWSQPWVQVALVVWLVNVMLAKGVVGSVVGELARRARVAGNRAIGPDVDAVRRSVAWTLAGDLLVAHDLAMVLLMTLRLPLIPSLGALATSVGVVFTLAGVRGLRRAPGAVLPTGSGAA